MVRSAPASQHGVMTDTRHNKRIARDLRIGVRTVEDHLKAIFTKVGVSSRGELTAKIFADHFVP